MGHTIDFNPVAHILLLNLHNLNNNVVINCQRHGCVNPVCILKCVEMGFGISADSDVCKTREDTTEDYSLLRTLVIMYMKSETKHTVYSICICPFKHAGDLKITMIQE